MSDLSGYLGDHKDAEEIEELVRENLRWPRGWPNVAFDDMDMAHQAGEPWGMHHALIIGLDMIYATYALRRTEQWRQTTSIMSRANLRDWTKPSDFPDGLLIAHSALAIIRGDTPELRGLGRRIDERDSGTLLQSGNREVLELRALLGLARGDPELEPITEAMKIIPKARNAKRSELNRAKTLATLIDAVARLDQQDMTKAACELEGGLREDLNTEYQRYRKGRPSDICAQQMLDLSGAAILWVARGAGLGTPKSIFFDLDWIEATKTANDGMRGNERDR